MCVCECKQNANSFCKFCKYMVLQYVSKIIDLAQVFVFLSLLQLCTRNYTTCKYDYTVFFLLLFTIYLHILSLGFPLFFVMSVSYSRTCFLRFVVVVSFEVGTKRRLFVCFLFFFFLHS